MSGGPRVRGLIADKLRNRDQISGDGMGLRVALPLHVGAELFAEDSAAGGGFDCRTAVERDRAPTFRPFEDLLRQRADRTGELGLDAVE